jgi:hypothetical protein
MVGDFTTGPAVYSEPYYPDQFCQQDGCGVLMDQYTKPEDHDVLCPHHPDHRLDLAELEELEAGPLAAPVARREVA